ncbi:hypothetical protein R1sor_026459 [Riccia sorocarpa]|uniref:Fungal lipase-type domain-containing protein n=1 Tax=Riccia sorocarpa TaxID=122646 RepID=A0ABD3GF40_9MARC
MFAWIYASSLILLCEVPYVGILRQKPRNQSVPLNVKLATLATLTSTTLTGYEPPKVNIATKWRELQGTNNWAGLLSPLDLDLRREILRYGDYTHVTYDAFPLEKKFVYPSGCPYTKAELLSQVGLPETGYEVTRYLYAHLRGLSSAVQEVNWIGFIAVAVDPNEIKRIGRRDIIVAWRGTQTDMEWQNNFLFDQIQPTSINGKPASKDVKVSSGFWGTFADFDASKSVFGTKGSAAKNATQEVKRLVGKYAGEEMSITCIGHSLGGALATLCAYQIAEDEIHKTPSGTTIPITAFTFASPRVGNIAFGQRLTTLGVRVLRIKCNQDLVPCFPLGDEYESSPIIDDVKKKVAEKAKTTEINNDLLGFFIHQLNQALLPDDYTHVGTTLAVDFTKSPYLKQPGKYVDLNRAESFHKYHNLHAYLHLVNGTFGSTADDLKKPFKPVVVRDLALINKRSGMLADPYGKHVPEKWWRQSNAGLVQTKEGFWVYPWNFDDPKLPNPDYD